MIHFPKRLSAPALVILASFALRPVAAAAAPENIDRIVAVVNDDIVLLSEIEEQVALLQAAQQMDLSDSTRARAVRQQVLDQLIEERLIVDYATKQGITIADEQVEAQLQNTLKDVKERVGSDEKFKAELDSQGLTEETLKDRYRKDLRRQMIAQRIVDREIRARVKVTDADVDTFYRNNRDDLPRRPAQYHLAHILITPRPDAQRRNSARLKANEILFRLKGGEGWNEVAAKYSEDPSTARNGGDLGEVKEGDLDEKFEAAVRDLKPGERTGIVETRFGFHIIELVSRTENTYHPRHILIMAQPTPEDQSAAIEKAGKARRLAVEGTDWNVLVTSYSDDDATKETGGELGDFPASRLPREYVEAFDSLSVGGISPVLQGPSGYHVFKLLGKELGGDFKLDDIRADLTSMLTQRKLEEEYTRWIKGIREKAFVEVKGL